jgi:hypothetical protein
MTTEPGQRMHLRLVTAPAAAEAPVAPAALPTREESQVMEQVAADLRRSARTLPRESSLRAELMETAEYYGAGGVCSVTTTPDRCSSAGDG